MDLGSSICTPKSPKCSLCPVQAVCQAKEQGIAADLPVRKAKKAKPQKHGHVYWITNHKGEVCFVRRGEKEMLGGMMGLPTSDWVLKDAVIKPIKGYDDIGQFITHSFTHFDLKLDLYAINLEKGTKSSQNNPIWVSQSQLNNLGLPTLFKKVVKLITSNKEEFDLNAKSPL